MPLIPTVLSSGIEKIEDSESETEAIQKWADAWNEYMISAAAGAVPLSPAAANIGRAAMVQSMAGLSVTGAAAIQSGITAYWGALASAPAVAFAGAAAVTPPPGLGGVAGILLGVFSTNVVDKAPRPVAAQKIATALHGANMGGTATIGGSPVDIK